MATPNLDILNVQLAILLGDPVDEDGVALVAGDDGITYSSDQRDMYITEALRDMINTLGHDFLEFTGFASNYTVKTAMTANEMAIPSTISRVFMVTRRDEKLRFTPLADQEQFNNLLTAHNTEMWRVTPDNKVVVYNMPEATWPANQIYMHGLEAIPALEQGGSNDVKIDTYYWPLLLRYAEVIGRRNHQESQQMVGLKNKETDDRITRLVNTEGEKWH